MRRKRKNTHRHLRRLLKVIKSSVDLVVSVIIVIMRCSHLLKPDCALTQHAQLDGSNECRCGAPLTSSQLLECYTIRTVPRPTRTQIMSAAFFSLSPWLGSVWYAVSRIADNAVSSVPPHYSLHHRSTVHNLDQIVSTAYIVVTNAVFSHFVKFLDW